METIFLYQELKGSEDNAGNILLQNAYNEEEVNYGSLIETPELFNIIIT